MTNASSRNTLKKSYASQGCEVGYPSSTTLPKARKKKAHPLPKEVRTLIEKLYDVALERASLALHNPNCDEVYAHLNLLKQTLDTIYYLKNEF